MTQDTTVVVGGVDAHAGTDHAAALDQRGALLCTKSFQTTTPGYRQLLDWLSGFGEIDAVAVESTGSYAAALVRYLREHDVRVVEVNQPHAHTRRRVGKSDPIDAEMAARLLLAGKATVCARFRPSAKRQFAGYCATLGRHPGRVILPRFVSLS